MPEPPPAHQLDVIDSSDEELRSARGLLALQALPGVGPAKALRAALLTTNYDVLIEEHASQWEQAVQAAHEELEQCARRGISVLAIFDKRYPQRLRALHDPPPVIYCHGSLDALDTPRSVAVVGTREPTKFGCSATEDITEALARAGWAVISGLAKGIDSMAHGVALEYHAPTVAVMAGGLDRIYPAQNKELAAAIVEQGGALVSEQRWGARPQRSSFVQRNRIQTGLAAAVVVAQTGTVGGTMHTVRHAAAQGRPVFCPVPHSAHEKNEGLRVLLNLPARELCGVLPAWKNAGPLCERLGNEPLARPVTKDSFADFLDALELALASDSQTVPEPRWWPPSDPPARLRDRDVVADDDAQAPLFAFAE